MDHGLWVGAHPSVGIDIQCVALLSFALTPKAPARPIYEEYAPAGKHKQPTHLPLVPRQWSPGDSVDYMVNYFGKKGFLGVEIKN